MARARIVWSVLAMLLMLAVHALAAAAPTRAQTLRGQVTDAETGEALPGANVVVTDRAGNDLGHGAATDLDGRFVIDHLAPGAYVVRVRFVGYAEATRAVDLDAGATVRLSVALAPETLGMDEVVVEQGAEARLAAATQALATLDGAALDRARGQTLGATLDDLPGVTTLTTGPSISKPVIRGLHSQRVIVLDAGVRQEGQQWGGEHAPEIDPFSAGRIQVVKGAAGVEHGAGAIGGVVRVEPLPLPEAPGVRGEVRADAFSNSWQGAGSGRVEGATSGGLAWRLEGSLRRAGDAHTPDYVLRNTAFAERSGILTLGYRTERTTLTARARRFDTELGIFRGAHVGSLSALAATIERGRPPRAEGYDFSYGIEPPKQRVTHDVVSLKAEHRFSDAVQGEVQYGVQRNRRREFDAHCRGCDDPGATPAFDLTLVTHTLDAKLRLTPSARPLGGDVLLTAGLSGMNQGNTNGARGYLIPNFRALTGGAFARAAWLRGDWTVEAGTRLDAQWQRAFPRARGTNTFPATDRTFRSVSGVVGAIWQFAPTWSVAANASTAWRPPSVNELYSYGVHHGTAQFEIGDAGLQAERVMGLDATLRHASGRASMQLSAYANRGYGFIHLFPSRDTLVTVRGVFPAFAHQQADVRMVGADGQIRLRVARPLDLGVRGSLVRADDLDLGEPLVGMPSDRATVFGVVRLPEAGGRLDEPELRLEGTFVRQQTRVPPDAEYAPPPDGYALATLAFDTEVRLGTTPVRLGLRVENLLNTTYRDYLSRYRYFADAPGRMVVLNVAVPFGGG